MDTSIATRRAFVGSAVAGAALLGATAPLARHLAGTPVADEVGRWRAAVGETFLVSTTAGIVRGRLAEVVAAAPAGDRPGGVRSRAFQAHFTFDAATAPAGNRIYALDHPVAGRSDLFLIRGVDVAGRAVLKALFD